MELALSESLKLTEGDIRPIIPEKGNTIMVLQVNARDIRDPANPDFGALKPEATEQAQKQAEGFFDSVFGQLNDERKKHVAILVCASNAPLVMPAGSNSSHQRAYETGEKVIDGIRAAMASHHVPEDRLSNTTETEGRPMVVEGLTDLTMWENKEFVKALLDKYGDTKRFWEEYEADGPEMQALRFKYDVEGPSEIAIRVRRALTSLVQNKVKKYHEEDPDALVYVWTVGQYDNISPFIKGYIGQYEPYYTQTGSDPSMWYLPADKGGGLTLELDEDGTVKTTIGKKEFVTLLLFKQPDEKTK